MTFLSSRFLSEYHNRPVAWGPVGYVVFKRTYARDLPEGGTEEWWQTCKRCVDGIYEVLFTYCDLRHIAWDHGKAKADAEVMYDRMFHFKFTPPGRGLRMMGTDFVRKHGSASLQNCGFTSTLYIDGSNIVAGRKERFADPFCWLMEMSMLGVGVGFDTRGAGLAYVQKPSRSAAIFTVEDTREGWVEALRMVMQGVGGNCAVPQFDYSAIRAKGAPIKGFGGIASGPEALEVLVEDLLRLYSDCGRGQKTTSTLIVDTMNYIGKAVLAGGVRRTAEIAFGSPDDDEFIRLKQDDEAVRDRRFASNNSIYARRGMSYDGPIVDGIERRGDPGLAWMENVHRFARMGDPDTRDAAAMGFNPCGEQPLHHREFCNLIENYPAHHSDKGEWIRTLQCSYLWGKATALIPSHDPVSNIAAKANLRIGNSCTGVVQALAKVGRGGLTTWLREGYDYQRKLDVEYSRWLGVRESIRLTTVKPSGTVSKLSGASAGVHHQHGKHYRQNIRMHDNSPVLAACVAAGYPTEKDPNVPNTQIVGFPVEEEHFVQAERDVSMWRQLDIAAMMSEHWADNAVSVTVKFHPPEVKEIGALLESAEGRLKAVSMLPHDDHGFHRPPWETVTSSEFAQLSAGITGDLRAALSEAMTHEQDDAWCDGPACEIPGRALVAGRAAPHGS